VRIPFDQGTPVPLRRELDHAVETAFELQWSTLGNGELLTAAENEGFEVLVTTDRGADNSQLASNPLGAGHSGQRNQPDPARKLRRG